VSVNLDAISDSLSRQKSEYNNNFKVESNELRQRKLTWIKEYLGLSKYSGYSRYAGKIDTGEKLTNYYFHRQGSINNIKGYSYLLNAKGYNDTTTNMFNGIKFTEKKSLYKDYSLEINNENVSFDLSALAKKLILSKKATDKVKNYTNENEYIVSADSLILISETKYYTIELIINSISVNQSQKGNINITYADADYLIKEK